MRITKKALREALQAAVKMSRHSHAPVVEPDVKEPEVEPDKPVRRNPFAPAKDPGVSPKPKALFQEEEVVQKIVDRFSRLKGKTQR